MQDFANDVQFVRSLPEFLIFRWENFLPIFILSVLSEGARCSFPEILISIHVTYTVARESLCHEE